MPTTEHHTAIRGCISGNATVKFRQRSYAPMTYECRARVFKDNEGEGYCAEALRFPGRIVRADSLDSALREVVEIYQSELTAYLNSAYMNSEPPTQWTDIVAMQQVGKDDQRWVLVQLKDSVQVPAQAVSVDQDLAAELAAWDAASTEIWNNIE